MGGNIALNPEATITVAGKINVNNNALVTPNGEIGLYNNEQELIDLIEDGLTTDKTNQTEKAYQFIVSNHTFEKRVEQMLDILYNHAQSICHNTCISCSSYHCALRRIAIVANLWPRLRSNFVTCTHGGDDSLNWLKKELANHHQRFFILQLLRKIAVLEKHVMSGFNWLKVNTWVFSR